jgi:uncharacterized protein
MNGAIAWHELYTDDVEAATRFYTELLGLELESADMPDFQYPMLKKEGRTHAGFARKDEEHEQILPLESMENVGRYAVLTDPTGAAFGLHHSTSQPE